METTDCKRFSPTSLRLGILNCQMSDEPAPQPVPEVTPPHRRRPRYSGKNPRRFEEKYKERDPQRHAETVAKIVAAGKTPAGTHRPIMVAEILEVLAPRPGEVAVDCTLGYGGHAQELLARIQPGGRIAGPRTPIQSNCRRPKPGCAPLGWPEVFTRTAATSLACRKF